MTTELSQLDVLRNVELEEPSVRNVNRSSRSNSASLTNAASCLFGNMFAVWFNPSVELTKSKDCKATPVTVGKGRVFRDVNTE